jgi:hypothetical protein
MAAPDALFRVQAASHFNQRSTTVKKIWMYLLGAALLAGALANPPRVSADGTPPPNCQAGQMCKP